MHTFIDRGGTFTDVVRCDPSGHWTLEKVPSDQAIIGNIASENLVFGTTVATNALLERAGVTTLLWVTEGFEDLVYIGDMTRPGLFSPAQTWPEPLCSRVASFQGRIDAQGQEVAALETGIPNLDGIESVAIVGMNSVHNPAHELALAARIRARHPHLALTADLRAGDRRVLLEQDADRAGCEQEAHNGVRGRLLTEVP